MLKRTNSIHRRPLVDKLDTPTELLVRDIEKHCIALHWHSILGLIAISMVLCVRARQNIKDQNQQIVPQFRR